MKRWIYGVVFAVFAAVCAIVLMRYRGGDGDRQVTSLQVLPDEVHNGFAKSNNVTTIATLPKDTADNDSDGDGDDSGDSGQETEPPSPKTQEDIEEEIVDAFDGLTDKWMSTGKGLASMKDVDEFVAAFKRIPKSRQDECIHRALNLVSDDNVMVLAGILMDKDVEKETVETVYNDILNRDEDVKKPILEQIFKDKTHPCWADTAWILDVTGELPTNQK